MTTVRLAGDRLTILRHSASTPGKVHEASIDLATGEWGCTCPARFRDHKHRAELRAVRDAIAALCGATGMGRYEAVLCLSRTMKVQSGMGQDWLEHQCGQHPDQIKDGSPPWSAVDTLSHQSAKLILADREAIKTAARKDARKVAA